jgi:NADH-ubiquinone/plastoquinone oxidoreductase, chain 3
VKFYLVAMAFIVLDVEIIFLYPFSTIFRDLGTYGIVTMGVFLLVLLVPFAYLLSTGAINWGPARSATSALEASAAARVRRAGGSTGRDGLDPEAPARERVA